ncbi:ATP-binding protein [Micromonospora sp. NPDC049679]|uniref:ATP-binding protein n=1 Tax=Micromonospora sp. NPDC049679 TaxID=3155920 RepID=UPI0033D0B2A7
MASADPSTATGTTARSAGHSSPPSNLDQRFGRQDIYALRSAVAAHATRLGAGTTLAEDLVLIAHELASNVIRHGGGTGRLRLWQYDGVFYCEVSDAGSGFADPDGAGRQRPPQGAPGGRGLWIVRQLSDHVDLRSGPGGTVVTVSLALDRST